MREWWSGGEGRILIASTCCSYIKLRRGSSKLPDEGGGARYEVGVEWTKVYRIECAIVWEMSE